MSDDAELARAATAGSETAFRALVERYATPAVNFAHAMVRDRAVAEDLAQEAFLRVFVRLRTFDASRSFRAWFFQVVRHVVIDHLRKRRLPAASLDQLADEHGLDAPSTAPSPEEATVQTHLSRDIQTALLELRPEYRQVVVLRYQEGLTQLEVAEAMELPEGTIKTYLHRARRELADRLRSQGWAPDGGAPSETV
mgnify:CR=1 FL=1